MNQRAYLSIGLLALYMSAAVQADIIHNENVIIDDENLCIGEGCVDNEDPAGTAVRIRKDNILLEFDDQSTVLGDPANDWAIIFNDSFNGGFNYFGIQDTTAGTLPFAIGAGAPQIAMVLASNGNLGLGTISPGQRLHMVGGNSPGITFEQDISAGQAAQTWTMAGNEFVWSISDDTNGFVSPFTIWSGAPNNAVAIQNSGNLMLGGGGANPADGSLHIVRENGVKPSIILETVGTAVEAKWEIKSNEVTGRLTFKDLNGTNGPGGGPTTPFKFQPTAAENLFRVGIVDDDTVDIGGNLQVKGDLVVDGNCTEVDGACADYVFEPDYSLRSLDQLMEFIGENSHLPNVPSAQQIKTEGVNLVSFTGRLLEKIEELTLYTFEQEQKIRKQKEAADKQKELIDDLKESLLKQNERLAVLEQRSM